MANNQKNILILFFTMIVVMLGFGMVIPIMPFYVRSFNASGRALGGLMALYGVLQFIFAPIWGGLSDRIGRKPVLMIGVLGNALAQLLFGLSSQLWMLFAARGLAGMLSSATLPTAMAYIGDSTSDEKRSGGMGVVGAAMGIGMVLGPGMGGILAKNSLSFPFFLASGLSMMALALIFIFLPEPPRHAVVEKTSQEGRLKQLGRAVAGPLGVLFVMSFLLSFGLTNFESVFGLYAADRFGYTPGMVGGILMAIGVVSAGMQGAATGPLTRKFGEPAVIRAALLGTAIGFILMSQAHNLVQVLVTVTFFVFSNALLNPSVASLISKRTQTGQGVSLGLNNSFLSLGRIAGPLWAGYVYDISYNAPYFTGSVIMLVGLAICLLWLKSTQPVEERGLST
jgi:DHA1 family multidrug resistance protein-like MFS transporter